MSAFSLEKEPFPESRGDGFYFSTPALVARCEQLAATIESGHVLLIDEVASGKSTMLDDVVQATCDRWRIFRAQADGRQSARDFAHDLICAFGLPARDPAAAALRDADALLELLTTQSRLAVVVLDDVHRLQPEALDQLLYLIKRWQKYSVRFLISAEPVLIEQLEARPKCDCFPGGVSTFDMPRFDQEQVGDYLHLCLFRAGLAGDSPFDSSVVAVVTERAGGLVGAIDPVARELLALAAVEGRAVWEESLEGRNKRGARRWPITLVSVAGIGVFLAVVILETSTSPFKQESRNQMEGFRSSITLAPRVQSRGAREGSAAADSLAP